MAISLKGLKKIKEESNKVIEVDLKKYITTSLDIDLILPFKLRPYKEQLKIKAMTDFTRDDIAGVKRVQFSKLPKELQELYADYSPANMKGGLSLVTLIDHSKNDASFQQVRVQEKLLDVVMHLDMDSVNSEGKTLWEEQDIPRNDFGALVELFSEIVTSEDFLNTLVFIVQGIKSNFRNKDLEYYILSQKFQQELNKIENIEERKSILADIESKVKINIENKEKPDVKKENIEKAEDPADAPIKALVKTKTKIKEEGSTK